jgi:predicted nucleic acid-binding protein
MLDTSAYSYFKRGQGNMVTYIRESRVIFFPAIVLGELYAGFEIGTHRDRNLDELKAFLGSPRVELVEITSETAIRYGLIYAYLRSAGRPIPTNDLWIAASVMEIGSTLITADQHFKNVPQILVNFIQ